MKIASLLLYSLNEIRTKPRKITKLKQEKKKKQF